MRIIAETTISDLLEVYPLWEDWVIGKENREMPTLLTRCGNDRVVIGELEPKQRIIRWRFGSKRYHHRVQLPYLQFLYWKYQIGASASSKPFELGDTFKLPPLPNVFNSGLVCQPLTNNIEEAITVFLGSYFEMPYSWKPCWWFAEEHMNIKQPFNMDTTDKNMLDWSKSFGETWESLSLSDPDFILRHDWSAAWTKDRLKPPFSALFHGESRRQYQPWAP